MLISLTANEADAARQHTPGAGIRSAVVLGRGSKHAPQLQSDHSNAQFISPNHLSSARFKDGRELFRGDQQEWERSDLHYCFSGQWEAVFSQTTINCQEIGPYMSNNHFFFLSLSFLFGTCCKIKVGPCIA